jgi:anti-sigma regulatory factor (Ser/Thr protein kinase)
MAEYWNVAPVWQEDARQFFMHAPEPEMSLSFEIAEKDFTNAGKGSAELKNMLKRLGVNPEVLRRIAVASYEAEINIAAHSHGGTMKSYIYQEFVYVTFNDTGPGISDIDQAMTPGFSTADELVREMGFGAGLGLPNIKKNSDVMHLKSEFGKPTKLEIIVYFNVK